MIPKYILFIVVSFFLTVGCQKDFGRKKIIYYDIFPKTVLLNSNTTSPVKDDIYPIIMGLSDSLLVLCDINSEIHFYVYNVPEMKYLGSFGKQGKGPKDFSDPVFWGQFEQTKTNSKIWVYQTNKMAFTLVDIIKSISTTNAYIEKNIIMSPETGAAVNIISLKNNKFVGGGRVEQGEFFIYNNIKNKIQWKPLIIDDIDYIEAMKTNNLLTSYKQGVIKIKPDKSKFVKIFAYMPIIDVYNENAELSFSIIMRDCKFPSFRNKQFDEETNVFFTNVFLTDNYIYALNQNCNLLQLSKNSCYNTEILVFDWNGKPVCKYRINETFSSMAPFVVDERNNKLYTISIKESGNFFKIYNL
jgi:hypothetical protein